MHLASGLHLPRHRQRGRGGGLLGGLEGAIVLLGGELGGQPGRFQRQAARDRLGAGQHRLAVDDGLASAGHAQGGGIQVEGIRVDRDAADRDRSGRCAHVGAALAVAHADHARRHQGHAEGGPGRTGRLVHQGVEEFRLARGEPAPLRLVELLERAGGVGVVAIDLLKTASFTPRVQTRSPGAWMWKKVVWSLRWSSSASFGACCTVSVSSPLERLAQRVPAAGDGELARLARGDALDHGQEAPGEKRHRARPVGVAVVVQSRLAHHRRTDRGSVDQLRARRKRAGKAVAEDVERVAMRQVDAAASRILVDDVDRVW